MNNNYNSDRNMKEIESDNEPLELVLTVGKAFKHGM